MKAISYYIILCLAAFLISCDNETERVFDKPAEQRVAEAIQALKDDLTAPENGWRLKYQPEDESGAYWLIVHFKEDNKVVIESDLGANDGEFFMDTLTYRIDNSIGLELIFETYSVFSFLFEHDQATFFAEYEYLYVNKTPEGSLVFRSKSDPGTPTIIVLEEAAPGDSELLGQEVAENINTISGDIGGLLFSSPGYQLTYDDLDLKLFLTLDEVRRTIDFSNASKKTTTAGSQPINFSTGYYLQGDSLVLQEPLTGTFQGAAISLKSILFTKLSLGQMDICGGIDVHFYEGITSQDDDVLLEATLNSPAGAEFTDFSFLATPLQNIFNNGVSMGTQIANEIVGAGSMQLYYDFEGIYAMGFFIQNADGTTTFYLREFTPVLTGNKIIFNFEPTITVFGNQNSPADIDNVNQFIEPLTQGGAYVFEIQQGIYELHNPCTGWSAAFFGVE
jgi:hypothetical protein